MSAYGKVNNLDIVCSSFDFNFNGGTLSLQSGQNFYEACEFAIKNQASALAVFITTGGAALQENLFALYQMPKTVLGVQMLKEKKIPFIIFVNTREINSNHPNYMTWDQIRELRDSGLVTIGGHSWSHEYFVDMKLDEVKKDIEKSHQDYLKELKFIPDLYAHTFGETSEDLINLIKKF